MTDQDGADQCHLKGSGSEVEDEGTENEADAPRAAIDGLGQRPRLATEMEAQVEVV